MINGGLSWRSITYTLNKVILSMVNVGIIDGVIGNNMTVTLVMILCPEFDSIENIAGQARPNRNLIYVTCQNFT